MMIIAVRMVLCLFIQHKERLSQLAYWLSIGPNHIFLLIHFQPHNINFYKTRKSLVIINLFVNVHMTSSKSYINCFFILIISAFKTKEI